MFSNLFGAKKEEKKEEPINPNAPSLTETSEKVRVLYDDYVFTDKFLSIARWQRRRHPEESWRLQWGAHEGQEGDAHGQGYEEEDPPAEGNDAPEAP